jgi:hypothetical protein
MLDAAPLDSSIPDRHWRRPGRWRRGGVVRDSEDDILNLNELPPGMSLDD